MPGYTVVFERQARKALDRIGQRDRERILKAIQQLATDPYHAASVKALQGRSGYRLRVGDFRVIYDIVDERLVVVIITIADRKDAYRG